MATARLSSTTRSGVRAASRSYHYFHAARAELLGRLGARDAAADAYSRALDLAGNAAERSFLERRLAEARS
jgi:RNA polymerase sigma-70 factor, ECF subfamily